MHPTIAMLLLLLVGPWITTLATAIASVARDIRNGRSMRGLVGNLATRVVPVFAAGLVYDVLHGPTDAGLELPKDYLPLALTMLTFAVVNELGHLFDAVADRAGRAGRSWREAAQRLMREIVPSTLQAFVGGGIGALCLDNPWAAPVVVPIAASAYLALERGNRVTEVTERALDTFARIVDERDSYTFEHSDRVCEYALMIGAELGLSDREMEALYWTSRLHDLGKVAIDNSILNKPGSLTDDEFAVMRQHPETSARILASFSFDEYDTEVVRCHHERYDGRGYLKRTRDTVPPEAFIIAVADSYDAMTSSRPYRAALARDVALREIEHGVGTQFDPRPALAFLKVMGHVSASDIEARAEVIALEADAELESYIVRTRVELGDDFREVA